jgi:hypothetical protein
MAVFLLTRSNVVTDATTIAIIAATANSTRVGMVVIHAAGSADLHQCSKKRGSVRSKLLNRLEAHRASIALRFCHTDELIEQNGLLLSRMVHAGAATPSREKDRA